MSFALCSKPIGTVDEYYVKKAREFAERHLRPNADRWEMNHEQPEETMRAAIKEFTGLMVPKELGGIGASSTTIGRVLEEMAKIDLGFTFALVVHSNTTYCISQIQDDFLRDRYLPKLMSGEMIGAFLLTEPGVGTDAASIQTRAEEQKGKWIINGDKAWVTNSSHADLLLVFAQSSEGPKGILGFLLEGNVKGIKRKKPYDMIGAHAMAAGEVSFSNCVVDTDCVAFPVGSGFKAAMATVDHARFTVGAMCNGVLQGCLDAAIDYIKERKAFGFPLIKQQGIQWKLADAVTHLEASRMLNFRAAIALENSENATLICAHSKKYATEVAWEGVHTAMQVMGANGLKRDYLLARQLTALRVTFFTDGTSEVCNIVIGRSL